MAADVLRGRRSRVPPHRLGLFICAAVAVVVVVTDVVGAFVELPPPSTLRSRFRRKVQWAGG